MYRLEYSARYSNGYYDTYYLHDDKGRVGDISGLLPYMAVHHDLKEIAFYQLHDKKENYELYDKLFRLVDNTLLNVYKDYEVNIIRTQYNYMYCIWKQNGRKF